MTTYPRGPRWRGICCLPSPHYLLECLCIVVCCYALPGAVRRPAGHLRDVSCSAQQHISARQSETGCMRTCVEASSVEASKRRSVQLASKRMRTCVEASSVVRRSVEASKRRSVERRRVYAHVRGASKRRACLPAGSAERS